MAISIEWGTKIITVPQSYLSFVSGTLYELDTETFRRDISGLLDTAIGMAFVDAYRHFTAVTIAGVSYARLIEIINGYTVTFEDGQYAVRLNGSNNNIFDEGIINRNQVSIIPTNSAGLISADQLLRKFEDTIYFDDTASNPGTSSLDGTRSNPVSTVAAALTLVASQGKVGVTIIEGLFALDRDVDNMEFHGAADPETSTVNFSGFNATRCSFEHCTLTGDANENRLVMRRCVIEALTEFHGLAENCYLRDHMLDATVETMTYDDCRSNVQGSMTPQVHANDRLGGIENRAYAGGFALTNLTSSLCDVSMDMHPGHFKLDNTCTDVSSMVVRGPGKFTNTSSISLAKIDTIGLNNPTLSAFAVWEEPLSGHTISGTAGKIVRQIVALAKAILGLS